jgi:hypothetical protein
MASIIHKINSISTKIDGIEKIDVGGKNSIMLKIDSLLNKLHLSEPRIESESIPGSTESKLEPKTTIDGSLIATITDSDIKFDNNGNKLETEKNKIKTIQLIFKNGSDELEAIES